MFYHSCSISIILSKHNYICIWKKLPWLREAQVFKLLVLEELRRSSLSGVLQLGHGDPERGCDFSKDAKMWEPRISDSHFFAISITVCYGVLWDLKQEMGKKALGREIKGSFWEILKNWRAGREEGRKKRLGSLLAVEMLTPGIEKDMSVFWNNRCPKSWAQAKERGGEVTKFFFLLIVNGY